MALDWDRLRWILVAITIGAFLVALVGAIGEALDWWGAIGEVMMTTGTVVGVLVGTLTLVGGASREQVQQVHAAVVDGNRKLAKLDRLDVIEGALIDEDNGASKLDGVQLELDRQTGVLDHQVELLTAIRDRL